MNATKKIMESEDMGLFGTKEEREKKREEKLEKQKALLKEAVYETLLKDDKSFSAGRLTLAEKDVPLQYMQEALDSLVADGLAVIDGTDRYGKPTYRRVRR